MSEYKEKEVFYYLYCKSCVYEKKEEHEYPCYDCLESPVNEYSHKPIKYVSKEDGNVK